MAIVVVGGHSRNIGKTSVVCRLISAFPECAWTAVKITQFGPTVYSPKPSACETADQSMTIIEERSAANRTDSSRYLAAGAARSLWVRTHREQLATAIPRIQTEIARAENVILESNSVLRFLNPDLYLAVLDPSVADFKPSALHYLERADALLYSGQAGESTWPDVPASLLARVPAFSVAAPAYWSDEVERFVGARLSKLPKSAVLAAR